jgi:multiple sugar transport system permease protein
MVKSTWNQKSGDFVSLAVLLLGALIVLLPLFIVFLTSFVPPGATPEIVPKNWSLANYHDAWQRGKFLLAFANSTLDYFCFGWLCFG